MGNKILVLSATENVGKPLVDMLLKNFVDVKAASRGGKSSTFSIRTAEGVCFDFLKPETYEKAFDDVYDGVRQITGNTPRTLEGYIHEHRRKF
ncbi:MAG: hypothetical protein ACK5MG_03535 [Bacteroidales bacterium]